MAAAPRPRPAPPARSYDVPGRERPRVDHRGRPRAVAPAAGIRRPPDRFPLRHLSHGGPAAPAPPVPVIGAIPRAPPLPRLSPVGAASRRPGRQSRERQPMSVVSSKGTPAPGPAPDRRAALARALRGASYEVLPFRSTEEKVLADVPRDVALTVTTTEAKGLGPTLELAGRLAGHGYSVAPHLAARLVRDDEHLTDVVAQLREAGVDSAFVVGGAAPEPAGRFTDALGLLEALDELGRPFATVGIGGYP